MQLCMASYGPLTPSTTIITHTCHFSQLTQIVRTTVGRAKDMAWEVARSAQEQLKLKHALAAK